VHGQWARIKDVPRRLTDAAGNATAAIASVHSDLLGALSDRTRTHDY